MSKTMRIGLIVAGIIGIVAIVRACVSGCASASHLAPADATDINRTEPGPETADSRSAVAAT